MSGAVAKDGNTPITDPRAQARVTVGETVLDPDCSTRVTRSSSTPSESTALVIAEDGRPLGVPPYGQYSEQFVLPAGKPFQLTSAMRYDLLIKPTTPGVIPFVVDYWDWVAGVRRGRARTQIMSAEGGGFARCAVRVGSVTTQVSQHRRRRESPR